MSNVQWAMHKLMDIKYLVFKSLEEDFFQSIVMCLIL
jgi:hypothetical protein